ncbi:activator of basal transcription 1-like, partial [Sinocyclocheilus rhinocerous]
MALPEKNEVTANLETHPMVNEEEFNDSKREEDEKQEEENADDADSEDDGEALDLDINEDEPEKPKGKNCIPGIVYLGHIPPRMRPKHMRTMLSVYG